MPLPAGAKVTATIQRVVRSDDGDTYEDDHTEEVYITAGKAKDAIIGHEKSGLITFDCYTDPGADILEHDRIVVGDRIWEVRAADFGIIDVYDKFQLVRYTPQVNI